MLKSTKIILITAGVLIGLGMIIGGIALAIGKAKGFSLGETSTPGASGGEDITFTVSESFKNIDVHEVSSDVNVSLTNESNAYVEYHNGETYEHNVTVDGNTLKIKFKNDQGWIEKWSAFSWIDQAGEDAGKFPVNIYLPASAYNNIRLYTVSGGVSVKDIECKDLDIDTTSGSAKVSSCNISDKASADAVSGEIRMSDLSGCDFNASTTSGSVNLTDCDVKDADIETVSGAVILENFKAVSTDIDTTSGDVRMKGYESASTDINTTSGDIDAEVIGSYNVEYDTVSGDVDIDKRDSAGAKMDIDTTSGDITIRNK